MNIFEQAARQKIRFESVLGLLCVEDLWDLPLTSLNSKRANLDDIARSLDFQLKSRPSISFVNATGEVNAKTQLAFDVVLHIINVKIAEAKVAEQAHQNREKKQKIMAIIERKQEESLSAASIEDLQQMLASL